MHCQQWVLAHGGADSTAVGSRISTDAKVRVISDRGAVAMRGRFRDFEGQF